MAKYKPSKISREKKSDVKKRFGNIFFFFDYSFIIEIIDKNKMNSFFCFFLKKKKKILDESKFINIFFYNIII